jgi:hypothetical protein
MATMTLRGLGDALHADERLSESMVQQYEGTESRDTPVKKQGGEGREQSRVRATTFRVVLWHGKKLADETKPTLREALYAAFDGVGIEPSPAVAEAFPRP